MLSLHFVIHSHIFIIFCCSCLQLSNAFLFFSNNTVLQLTGSVSVPIADLPPNRKIIWDWGVQMNYNMPYNPASFYNVPIWPTKERVLENERSRRSNERFSKYWGSGAGNGTVTRFTDTEPRNAHRFDFTAGELYRSLERLIESHGYHSSCLLQSVCDLAKHPFDIEHKHLLTELISFVFTPSWHLAFEKGEDLQRTVYENAERTGILGLNCKRLYPLCRKSLLKLMTNVIFDDSS